MIGFNFTKKKKLPILILSQTKTTHKFLHLNDVKQCKKKKKKLTINHYWWFILRGLLVACISIQLEFH